MEPVVTKEVIFGYFAGTCTAFQKELIESWVKEEANRELFFQWLYEWERKNVQYNVDVEAGLERHREWLKSQEATSVPAIRRVVPGGRTWNYGYKVAGSIAAVILVLWFWESSVRYRRYATDYGEIQKVALPDGSKVVLNANSEIRFSRFGFGKGNREIRLRGEASFDVVHTADHSRFRVLTPDKLEIEVLGTVFNVYARGAASQVVLDRGRVQLSYRSQGRRSRLTMEPGDLVRLDGKGKVLRTKTSRPSDYAAWRYHRFVFEALTFSQIGQRLEEVFGKKIRIEDAALAAQVVSGSFTALDAEELLDILSEAGNFSYYTRGDTLVVKPRNALPSEN